MKVNERWLSMVAEERIRDIQREAAMQRLVKEAQGTRTRFTLSLRWLRLPNRPTQQQDPCPPVRSLT
jgi:hypothetical protein